MASTSTGKNGDKEKPQMDSDKLTQAFGFDPELYNEQRNNID